ncbi:MAG: hypothetical protein AAGB46_06600 [Verrucomicrobiota bacterium]
MKANYRDIIVKDSRSENMLKRLLDVPRPSRERRMRRMLFARSGALMRCES